MTSQTFNLELIPKGIPPIVNVSQYDKGQTWAITILKDGEPFTIPSGSSIVIEGTKEDGTGFQYSCTYSGSTVTATEQQQMTVFAGDVPAQLRITKNNDLIGTLNFIIRVEPAALADDTIISETDLPLIEEAAEMIAQVPSIINQMEGLSEDAEAWAVGTRNGVAVPNTDPAYHNNAKYYGDNTIGCITDSQWASINSILA